MDKILLLAGFLVFSVYCKAQTAFCLYMNRGVKHPVVISHSAAQQESAIFSPGLKPGKGITTLPHLERGALSWK